MRRVCNIYTSEQQNNRCELHIKVRGLVLWAWNPYKTQRVSYFGVTLDDTSARKQRGESKQDLFS